RLPIQLFPYTTLFRSDYDSIRLPDPGLRPATLVCRCPCGEGLQNWLSVRRVPFGAVALSEGKLGCQKRSAQLWRLVVRPGFQNRSEEHTSELQSRGHL